MKAIHPEADSRTVLADAAPAVDLVARLTQRAVAGLRQRVAPAGRSDPALLDTHQFAVHGLAWLAAYATALREVLGWARRLDEGRGIGETETLLLTAAFGETLSEIRGGIAMSQGETVRPRDLGLAAADLAPFDDPPVDRLIARGTDPELRARLAALLAGGLETGSFWEDGLADPDLLMMRDQIRRFAAERIAPAAAGWHRDDALIPLDTVAAMAELGVFAVSVPAEHGGLGLSKIAMCVVTEELSRASLVAGSLGTRAEIAAELIRSGGTPAQQAQWLPPIASGACLPTAVFTEPGTGSDLAHLQTRAVRDGAVWRVTGAKTWITHAARADLMTLLVRTDPAKPGHDGLSMLLAPKPRGSDADPFPVAGLSGSEIPVLGYRGMKEYALSFDGFAVPAEGLLGGVEGQGFRQLMATFESARIQTAARAIGVATAALAEGLRYAGDRMQFGRPIAAFPRVAAKLARMATDLLLARQLAYHAAAEKDRGRRVDVEAGMAKLIGARAAWAAADNAVQIHGGNGYAEEFAVSRLLVDARILSIFEGSAEIQAQVIARGLIDRRN